MVRVKGVFESVNLSDLEVWREANVRKHEIFENIGDLAKNIVENGLQVPLIAWHDERQNKYRIISGQRRFQACRMVKYDPVECLVVKKPPLYKARVLSLSENLYRRSMTADDISDACDYLY